MKILLPLFAAFLLIACSGSETEASNTTTYETIETDTTSAEVINEEMLNASSAEALLASYIRIRTITAPSEEAEQFEVSGEVFWDSDGLSIININEQWGQYNYSVAIVLGATNQVEENYEGDGMYPEIEAFLAYRMNKEYKLLKGNFTSSAYRIKEESPIMLNDITWVRTEVEGSNTLFFVREKTQLMRTKVVANTRCLIGECEELSGFQESFKIGADPGQVIIERIENHTGECLVQVAIKYQKIWTKPEQMMFQAYPRKFYMGFADTKEFKEFPETLYEVFVDGTDTVTTEELFIKKEHNYNTMPHYGTLIIGPSFESYETLVIGFIPNGKETTFLVRDGGMNTNSGDYFFEKENEMYYEEITVMAVEESPGLYQMVRRGTATLWCVDQHRYPFDEFEEEGY